MNNAHTVMLVYFADNDKGHRFFGMHGTKKGSKARSYELQRHINLVNQKWAGRVTAAYIHEHSKGVEPDFTNLKTRIMYYANGVWHDPKAEEAQKKAEQERRNPSQNPPPPIGRITPDDYDIDF